MTIPAQLAPAAYLQKPGPITPAWCLLIHGKRRAGRRPGRLQDASYGYHLQRPVTAAVEEAERGLGPLRSEIALTTLQVNLGKLCKRPAIIAT